jgi:hypothetical protein
MVCIYCILTFYGTLISPNVLHIKKSHMKQRLYIGSIIVTLGMTTQQHYRKKIFLTMR